MSKKSAAIAAFEYHKYSIDSLPEGMYSAWQYQLIDLVSNYMGPDSTQYKGVYRQCAYLTGDEHNEYYRINNNKAKNLINSYIQFIKINGVYKDKKSAQNVLGTLKDEVFFSLLIAIIGAFCTASYYIGFNNGRSEKGPSEVKQSSQVEETHSNSQLQVTSSKIQKPKGDSSKSVLKHDSIQTKRAAK